MSLNESIVKEAAAEWLRELGYAVGQGCSSRSVNRRRSLPVRCLLALTAPGRHADRQASFWHGGAGGAVARGHYSIPHLRPAARHAPV